VRPEGRTVHAASAAEVAEQGPGGRVQRAGVAAGQGGFDRFGHHLAVFDAELVEGVDAQDHAGHEGGVLIGGQQGADGAGVDGGQQDEGAGPVARESLVPVFAVGFVGQRFAQGQCGALGQAVGHEDLVALVIRAAQGGRICLAGDDEVHRHGVGALVQLLELSLTGLLAGLMGAAGATLLGWLLAREVFDFAYQPSLWLLSGSILASMLFIVLAGGWNIWRLLDPPPLRALRGA